MHFLLTLALSAVAAAQSTITTTNTATTTHTLTPQETCIAACAPTDVTCQAICVGVPHPGNSQMNDTTNCVAACDQGDGSKAATDAYTACRNACISSYIVLTGTAAPGGAYTTALAPGQPTPSGAAANTTASPSAASNSSGTASSTTSKAFAAPTVAARIGATGGTLGLILAAIALL